MKEILNYLKKCEDMAWHNRLCCSETYAMTNPRPGSEERFEEAVRECEIVEELIALVKGKEATVIQTSPAYCPVAKRLEREIDMEINIGLSECLDGVDIGQPGGDNTAIFIQFPSCTDIEKICEAVYKKIDEMTSDSGVPKMQYGCSKQEIAEALKSMEAEQKKPQRVTRRGIIYKGEEFYVPELLEYIGKYASITDGMVYCDGKAIYRIS